MASWAVFHEEVDICLIVEETVELDDVGVVQVKLDFNLLHEGLL